MSHASGKSARASKWSVTINMRNVSRDTADECIARARQMDWRVFGQLEKGDEEGTEHYQLAVATPQIRFSAVKKVFPTAHIEVAKDWHALLSYCQKEETRQETLKNVSTAYISWKQVRDMFFDWLLTSSTDNEISSWCDEDGRYYQWDFFIGHMIRNGYEVDLMGVNPNYRACINRYWSAYLSNARCRQTDRQTEQNVVVPVIHKQDGVEEASSEGSEESEEGSEDESWASDESPF